jgi:GGDEF domain-containing protein
VEQKNKELGRTYQLSLSVGVLCCDASLKSLTMDELLAKADDLMYLKKKQRGRKA